MPARPLQPCTTPGCSGRAILGRCDRCRGRAHANPRTRRDTAAGRGYGSQWAKVIRPEYLLQHPRCVLCGRIADLPDHYPVSRRRLVALGVPDPDADQYLRPLCRPCHKTETARRQPGGWWRNEMP
jgi:5-methylcytosine-specific restriction enzyme A